MQDYYGSEKTIAAQKRLREMHQDIATNPALSNGGRILNILDLEAVGMDTLAEHARLFGFASVTAVPIAETRQRLLDHFGEAVDISVWLAILGDADSVLPACRAVVERFAMPDGWTLTHLDCPTDSEIDQIAALSLACEVAPAPVYYIRSKVFPHLTSCLWDNTGALVATAAASQRYHPESRFGDAAFAGGVAVSADRRRMGLGQFINAAVLLESHARFGWNRVLEQARADNAASRGMIRACGLREDLDIGTIAVNLTGEFITR
jgi:GNAT superfamily N-acetyltransferase